VIEQAIAVVVLLVACGIAALAIRFREERDRWKAAAELNATAYNKLEADWRRENPPKPTPRRKPARKAKGKR
jgi:hypothetical protein